MEKEIDFTQDFPFKSIRKHQENILNQLSENWNDYEYFIINAPTGSGKSALALSLAKHYEKLNRKSLILTTQKILQDQYEKDFERSDNLLSLKGKSNYNCYKFKGYKCDEAPCQILGDKFNKQAICNAYQSCEYFSRRAMMNTSPIVLLNYSFALVEFNFTGKLEKKDLMIIDEAHNVESQIMDYAKITIGKGLNKLYTKFKERDLFQEINIILDGNYEKKFLQTKANEFLSWMKELKDDMFRLKLEIMRKIENLTGDIEEEDFSAIKESMSGEESKLIRLLKNELSFLEKSFCKFNNFFKGNYGQDMSEWIFELSVDNEGNITAFNLKPIRINKFSHNMLFQYAGKKVLMSGTLLGKEQICKDFGIPPEKALYLEIESPFPIKNHPITFIPCGKLSYGNTESLKKMVESIDKIIEKNEGKKGIIHSVSYNNMRFIYEHSKFKERLLIHEFNNKNEVLNLFKISEDKVFISPSSSEGLDLKDDLSRFQIIMKIPFPNLGNLQVLKRKDLDPKWYNFQTVISLVQSFGRSIRNEKDYAETYILDSHFNWFYKQNQILFPSHFRKAIKFKKT